MEISLYRRVVVFPLMTPVEFQDSADEAWWQIRELLTEKKRFLVASKNFLVSKGVFQSRGSLSPADVVILSRLLDSHLIVTTYLRDNKLTMSFYEGESGRIVWEENIILQSSLPRSNQLIPSSLNLMHRFINALPYQGFVLKDEITGRSIYDRQNRTYFKVYTGKGIEIEVGNKVQLIRLVSVNLKPVLESINQEVFAEGKVASVHSDFVEVELLRATSLQDVKENSLVRFPQDLNQVKNTLDAVGELKSLGPEYYSGGERELTKEEKERKPLVTALTFVTNIIGMLLIAF